MHFSVITGRTFFFFSSHFSSFLPTLLNQSLLFSRYNLLVELFLRLKKYCRLRQGVCHNFAVLTVSSKVAKNVVILVVQVCNCILGLFKSNTSDLDTALLVKTLKELRHTMTSQLTRGLNISAAINCPLSAHQYVLIHQKVYYSRLHSG